MEDFPSSRYQVWLQDHHRSPLFDQLWKITISKGLKDPKGSFRPLIMGLVIFQFPWLATCNGQICCQICRSARTGQLCSTRPIEDWLGWLKTYCTGVRLCQTLGFTFAVRLPYVGPMGPWKGSSLTLWSMVFKMVEDFVPRSARHFLREWPHSYRSVGKSWSIRVYHGWRSTESTIECIES